MSRMKSWLTQMLGLTAIVLFATALGFGAMRGLQWFDARESLDESLLPELVADAQAPLVLFATTTCPYCRQARELLDGLNASYSVREIDVSESAREQFERLGGKGVPVLVSRDSVISGFDEAAYRKLVAASLRPAGN